MNKQSIVFALFGVGLLGNIAQAAPWGWGAKELLIASEAATQHFKESLGQAQFDKITGIAVELNAQKIAAKAKITYLDGGASKTVSYFCHEHEVNEIDCH